jgi:predicted SnoaL-like aldol condensation-catalyzing enzyme
VHRLHINLWLVAVVGLAAGLVALGSWVLVDRYGGGATHDATTLIDDVTAAWTAGNAQAVGALYTTDAVYVGADGTRFTGKTAITNAVPLARASGVTVERIAPVTVNGDFATTFVRYADNTTGGPVTIVDVFQLKDGKILRQWDAGVLGETAPFTNAVMP